MKPKYNVADEVAETLRLLEGLDRAGPPPFFFTRLQARLDRRRAGEPPGWAFRPAVVVAMLGVVGLLNLGVAVYSFHRPETPDTTRQLATELGIDKTTLDW